MGLPRTLCVILALWMVSSRPSTSVLPGTPVFRAWWGTPSSHEIARKADAARRKGDLDAAESYFQQGYKDAVCRRDEHAIVGYLNGIAACRLTELRYSKALESLLEAKDHAMRIGDRESLGAIAVNLSSLDLQVHDFKNALKEAEDGLAATATLKRPYFLASLLVQLGYVHDVQHDPAAAEAFYRQGIEVARINGDKVSEALGLDLLSAVLLGEHRLDEAEKAIAAGIDLRQKSLPKELDFSWWRMGGLRLAQHRPEEAAGYTEMALKARNRAPEYRLVHQRGEIREAMGDEAGALADFRRAMDLSSGWRMEVLPASSSLTAADEWLEEKVFTSFIESAAKESLRTGDQRLAEEAFESVELNRAASLRKSLELSEAWHKRVDPQYWEVLAKLRRVEVANLARNAESSGEADRLRMELTEMEAKAGLGFQANNNEIFRDQSSLIHFRQGLGESEVLLSFHLGERESYLWVVTRETLKLQRLASEREVRSQVEGLVEAVQDESRDKSRDTVERGERLYQLLFGQIGQEAASKPKWLLSLEGSLFEAPFAALVTERKDGKVSYLVSKHSLQTIPGALLLSSRPDAGTGWFLGVGDPIYNAADPRWKEQQKQAKQAFFATLVQTFTAHAANQEQYGRLVASADEVEQSAKNWGGSHVLLEGSTARRDAFLEKLQNEPKVIHLATHVLYRKGASQAFIAFGLGPNGSSEFLTTTDVAALRTPGAFVAMTGCETGLGDPRKGAGLLGLTQAWQMAGASTVLATPWPVRDSSGDLLASFYKHLRQVPPAEALRLSQMEMIESATWKSEPGYWAAYQITGGAR